MAREQPGMRNQEHAAVTAGEDVRTGVQGIAAEIDERLSAPSGASTAELRALRCEFSVRLKEDRKSVV